MKQIIAIGGGGFGRERDALNLEKYLIQQTKKKSPKVGFLAQASAEDPSYLAQFYKTFLALNAQPSVFSLFGRVQPEKLPDLLDQDLIFVGGGNTRSMLTLWREWGVDKILKQAYDKGIILAGVSAGAICWFEQGVTDSVWPLGILDCLNFVPGSCCPHYSSEPERRPFCRKALFSEKLLPGIALEDYTAAHFIDGKLHKVISVQEGAQGYLIRLENGEVVEEVV